MNYIVMDLEWNGAKPRGYVVRKPIHLNGEIIQIGAVKMNDALDEVIDSFNVIIKPQHYTKMTKIAHDVTLLTDDDLAAGILFPEAITQFKEWCGEDFAILTWGSGDIPILKENLIIHEMDCEWIPECFDAQIMFDDEVTGEGRDYALSYAIWKLGIKAKAAHDALNDASNTADVIMKVDATDWINEERKYRLEQVAEAARLKEEAEAAAEEAETVEQSGETVAAAETELM